MLFEMFNDLSAKLYNPSECLEQGKLLWNLKGVGG
jgi:hypothetical protein